MGVNGPRPSIAQLVDLHYQSLFRYAYRLSGNPGDAEDLTQEAFCKAQAKWGQLRDVTQARSWLFRILRNAYLQRCRSRKVGEVSLELIGDPPQESHDGVWEIDPEQLQSALNRLPEDFRTPIILYYFEDFTYREIAEQVGIPLGTVMSRLARAKAWLRQQLAEDGTVRNSQPREMNG